MTGEILKAESVLKIGQRVEFYLENESDIYTSRIEDILTNELVVAMPMDDKRRPIIPAVGESLYGRAVGPQCRYRFFSTYIDKKAEPIPVWRIQKPEFVERQQNREYVRVRVHLPVKLQVVTPEGKREPQQESWLSDISGGGMAFLLDHRVVVGGKIAFALYDLPEIGLWQGLARVARCSEIELPQGKRYRVGVRFLDMPRAVQNKLIRYIFELQRQELSRGISGDGVSE